MRARAWLLLLGTLVAAPAAAQDLEEVGDEPPAGWVEVRSVSGPLPRGSARRVVAGLRALLAPCARARARGPETMTAEAVDFDLRVDRSGRVTRVALPQLDPDERTPPLVRWRSCATRALRSARFEASSGASTIAARLVWSRGFQGGGRGWRVVPRAEAGASGELTLESLEAPAGRSRAVLRRALLRSMGAMRACYSRVLRSDPALAGTVTLAVDVDADGRVTRAEAAPDPALAPLAACLETVVRRTPLEAGAAGTCTVTLRARPDAE